jgi:hypothetical protein
MDHSELVAPELPCSPITQLCPGEHGHTFARGLSLAHLDATLRGNDAAEQFLTANAETALASRGVLSIS